MSAEARLEQYHSLPIESLVAYRLYAVHTGAPETLAWGESFEMRIANIVRDAVRMGLERQIVMLIHQRIIDAFNGNELLTEKKV